MMSNSHEKGFTVIELLVVIVLVGILASSGCAANYFRAKDRAREAETKSNTHLIQVALERYATDNKGQYPAMIWGGNIKGWVSKDNIGCRTMWQNEHPPFDGENESDAIPPLDPLILYGYLKSYPDNPFLDSADNEGLNIIIKHTGPSDCKPGDGDPRFGYDGSKMGNILEDPRYLWSGPDQPTRIKNCFLKEASENNISMINKDAPVNPFYAMGGIPVWKEPDTEKNSKIMGLVDKQNGVIRTYWPGEFFYRSAGTFLLPGSFLMNKESSNRRYIWNFKYSRIDRYILGCFGSLRTDGLDVIRLTDVNGNTVNNVKGYSEDCFYESHPSYKVTFTKKIHFSSPEIFGGGGKGKMPYFLYTDPASNEWLFGAPDGYRDGVVLTLTSGSDAITIED
jgi:prepilin-type N-terminal cleavage/methylation domain-containing protein